MVIFSAGRRRRPPRPPRKSANQVTSAATRTARRPDVAPHALAGFLFGIPDQVVADQQRGRMAAHARSLRRPSPRGTTTW